MKKFINDIDSVMRESLGGLVEAHPGLLRVEFEPTFVARAERASKKVALLSGGGALLECKAVGDRVNAATASMGVAFTSCTVPAAGRTTFDIGADEMEVGVGIHGEPGRRREKIKPAGLIVDDLLGAILADLKPERGREVLLHVNGFGGTPLMELYL